MKKITSIFVFCLITMYAVAQVPQVLFYGYIEEGIFENPNETKKKKKEKAPEKLKQVKVYVYEGDSLKHTIDARETGFYAILLDAGHKYRVTFEKEGYFCKCFELDCTEVEYPDSDAAMKCLTDVSMFKKVEDDDLLSLCKVPYAKCAYSGDTGEMVWDLEYTARAKEKFYELAEPYYMAQGK
jgi:hypothetical protein